MKKLFAVLMVAVLAVGCCSSCRWRYKNAKPLEGTVWHLVKIGGESYTFPADEFNIILNENSLGGRGACNSLLGQYATGDKYALRFSALGLIAAVIIKGVLFLTKKLMTNRNL